MPTNLESQTDEKQAELNEEVVQEALLLVERIRESRGGDLDDEAIAAVAEATGAPLPFVRAAVLRHRPESRLGFVQQIKNVFLGLDPDTRRHVFSGFLATNIAFLEALKSRLIDNGFFGVAQILLVALAAWNISLCRDSRVASISGAILGGLAFAATSLFALIFAAGHWQADPWLLIPFTLGGAFGGMMVHGLINRNRAKWGLRDPADERQDLLRQLVELQAKLDSGKTIATFLSIDVVGSTRMKEIGKPLEVEYTFTEYHNFVEMIARKHGGRVHSTAGDGVICAFDSPQQAFSAAKNMQTGIIELNAFRNKIGMPITLRAGIHSGEVLAPGSDISAVNFAHVIDVAAHLQKACTDGGIAISQLAAVQIPGGPQGIGTTRVEASGMQAVIWQPRGQTTPPVGPNGPPPPPR